ncbi:hypothetical protein Tco_0519228 [Tanacetum coccineum]
MQMVDDNVEIQERDIKQATAQKAKEKRDLLIFSTPQITQRVKKLDQKHSSGIKQPYLEKEYAVLWNNWYTKCEECKYDKISYDKAYNDMQQKIERLQAQLGDLKGFEIIPKENAHHKTEIQDLFDSIKVTQAQTKSIIDSLQKQLYDTIYDNAKLRAQLFDKVSERKGTTKGTRTNTMFTKQSILGKPPSSYKPKLYSVTPFPKSSVLPKVDKTNALSKTSPSTGTIPTLRIKRCGNLLR